MSLFLVKSLDSAVVLFLVGLFVALLFVEPFVGLIIYFTLLYIRPHEFIPVLATARLMLVIGGGTLGSMILRRAFEGRAVRLFHTPTDKILWCFFLSVVLSHLSHADIDSAVRSALSVGTLVAVYFLITNLVNSEKKLSVVVNVLGFLTIILAVQGIVQFHTGAGIGGQTVMDEGRIRSLGGFANPNALAMALLVGLPFLLFDLGRFRKLPFRVYSAAGVIIILYGLYLTNSRGAMLGLGGMV
ncbi:MAG: hypothetical protein JSW58_00630, partial [Candidatus Latescibacterota bacterium]